MSTLIGEMLANPHAPPDDISLGYEYAEALAAIENISSHFARCTESLWQ